MYYLYLVEYCLSEATIIYNVYHTVLYMLFCYLYLYLICKEASRVTSAKRYVSMQIAYKYKSSMNHVKDEDLHIGSG